MLWRKAFIPDISERDLGPVPFVGGVGANAFREMEVWRRLFAAAGSTVELRVPDHVRADAEAYFGSIVRTDQPLPERLGDRSCGYVPGLFVIGNPTEDIWERMLATLRGPA